MESDVIWRYTGRIPMLHLYKITILHSIYQFSQIILSPGEKQDNLAQKKN